MRLLCLRVRVCALCFNVFVGIVCDVSRVVVRCLFLACCVVFVRVCFVTNVLVRVCACFACNVSCDVVWLAFVGVVFVRVC